MQIKTKERAMLRDYEELPLPLRLIVLLGGGRFVLAYERWQA